MEKKGEIYVSGIPVSPSAHAPNCLEIRFPDGKYTISANDLRAMLKMLGD